MNDLNLINHLVVQDYLAGNLSREFMQVVKERYKTDVRVRQLFEQLGADIPEVDLQMMIEEADSDIEELTLMLDRSPVWNVVNRYAAGDNNDDVFSISRDRVTLNIRSRKKIDFSAIRVGLFKEKQLIANAIGTVREKDGVLLCSVNLQDFDFLGDTEFEDDCSVEWSDGIESIREIATAQQIQLLRSKIDKLNPKLAMVTNLKKLLIQLEESE